MDSGQLTVTWFLKIYPSSVFLSVPLILWIFLSLNLEQNRNTVTQLALPAPFSLLRSLELAHYISLSLSLSLPPYLPLSLSRYQSRTNFRRKSSLSSVRTGEHRSKIAVASNALLSKAPDGLKVPNFSHIEPLGPGWYLNLWSHSNA